MQSENNSSTRAIQALMDELIERGSPISPEIIQSIYEIEERVQFLSDRGPISEQIGRLIRSELDKGCR